jgi:hypothetical protein
VRRRGARWWRVSASTIKAVNSLLRFDCSRAEGITRCEGTHIEPVDLEFKEVCKSRVIPLRRATVVRVVAADPVSVRGEWITIVADGTSRLIASREMTLSRDTSVSIARDQAGTISAHVLNSDSGPDVRVQLRGIEPSGLWKIKSLDADRSDVTWDAIPTGLYELSATQSSRVSNTVTVRIENEHRTASIELTLRNNSSRLWVRDDVGDAILEPIFHPFAPRVMALVLDYFPWKQLLLERGCEYLRRVMPQCAAS